MRIGLAVVLAIACVSVVHSESQAALNVTSETGEAIGTVTSGNNSSGYNISEPIHNQTVVGSNGASFGPQGSLGDYSYDYSYGTSSSSSGNSTTLNALVSINTSAQSNQAPDTTSYEGTNAYITFTLTSTYLATLNFTSILDIGTSDNNLVGANGELYQDGVGVLSEFSRTAVTSGTPLDNSADYPKQLILGPGDYQLYMGVGGRRFGTFDVTNAGAAGTASLVLTAVPEPVGVVLWSCIVAGGLPKLRRYMKGRMAVA